MNEKSSENNRKEGRMSGAVFAALSIALAAAICFRIYLAAKDYYEYRKVQEAYAQFATLPDDAFPDFDMAELTLPDETDTAEPVADESGTDQIIAETSAPETSAPAAIVTTAPAPATAAPRTEAATTAAKKVYTFADFVAQLAWLDRKYDDFYCWIRIKNTVINYPVVQGGDNEYYLDHDIYGNKLSLGAIFADYRCDSPDKARNIVLYGHRAKYNVMFNQLADFMNASFFNANPYVYLYTPAKTYVYEVYAAYKTSMYSDFNQTEFQSDEDFLEHMNSFYSGADLKRNVTLKPGDRILTLSTCTNTDQSERYVVQARLVSIADN